MAKRTLTVEDLWLIPRVGSPEPAPDGSFCVVPVTTYDMKKNQGTTRLWRVATDGDSATEPVALTSDASSSSSPSISPCGQRMLFLRKGENEQSQVHVMEFGGGEAQCLTTLPYGAIDLKWFPDGKAIAFLSFVHDGTLSLKATEERKAELKDKPTAPIVTEDRWFRLWDQWLTDGRRLHLFRLDLESKVITDLTPKLTGFIDPQDPSGNYDIAPDGREIAIGATRRKRPGQLVKAGLFLVEIRANGTPGALRDTTPPGAEATAPRYSPDGRTILYGVHLVPDSWAERPRLGDYTRRTRRHRVLTEDWTLSPSAWAWRSDGKAIIAMAGVEGYSGLYTMSTDGKRRKELARGGTFAGLRVAGRTVYTNESTLKRPGEVLALGLRDGERTLLSEFTKPLMKSIAMGKVEDITLTGAEGDAIQMFLVHPPPKPRGKQKLVHLIHGGPHANFGDTWHFRWSAQAFAAQGYLVAMVNYHGSDGWGQAYRESIVGAWGDLSYRDVELSTDWLIKKRNVNPAKMAATGGSYGGYMASWIAGQTDRYACIVNHAGVCDLQTQLSCDVPAGWPQCAGGSTWKDTEAMDRYNPIRHAAGFKTPMLIIHGELDYRVPYYQALQIYNTYKARGLDARLVFYRDENHWILKPQNSVHWYGEVMGWLKRYL